MHYAIDIGHNAPPGDTGAVGYLKEDDLCRVLGGKVSALLRAGGHTVTECGVSKAADLNQSLKARVRKANASGADVFVSLHFNKFLPSIQVTPNPMGSEIYVSSDAGKKIALKVMPELTKLGFKIHDGNGGTGVKKAGFHVLVNTKMPAILIESFFLESKADVDLFNKIGMDKLAIAIVKGLTD